MPYNGTTTAVLCCAGMKYPCHTANGCFQYRDVNEAITFCRFVVFFLSLMFEREAQHPTQALCLCVEKSASFVVLLSLAVLSHATGNHKFSPLLFCSAYVVHTYIVRKNIRYYALYV